MVTPDELSAKALGQPIRQIAYFVDNAEQAARQHHQLFGSGPFFLVEHIPLSVCLHRGQPAQLDHTSAYGQWGGIMVEFCQQNNPGPSVFHDHPGGCGALHHVAVMVEDLAAAMQQYEQAGHATALYAEAVNGPAYAMMDCLVGLGHFVELYEASEQLVGFYELVRAVAQDWDGSEVIRRLPAH